MGGSIRWEIRLPEQLLTEKTSLMKRNYITQMSFNEKPDAVSCHLTSVSSPVTHTNKYDNGHGMKELHTHTWSVSCILPYRIMRFIITTTLYFSLLIFWLNALQQHKSPSQTPTTFSPGLIKAKIIRDDNISWHCWCYQMQYSVTVPHQRSFNRDCIPNSSKSGL